MKIGITILFISLLFGQVGAFMPAPGVAFYAHDVVVCILLAIGVVHMLKKRRLIVPRLFWPIVSFGIVGSVSLLFVLLRFAPWQVGQGSLYLVRWIFYSLVYMGVVQMPTMSAFLLRGLYITGSAFSVIGLLQYVLYPNLRNLWYLGWDPHYYRLFGTFLDPNFAGLFILLTFLLGCVRPVFGKWRWVAQGINLVALYLTYSRGSYVAILVAGLVWIAVSKRWNILWYLMAAVALIILIPRPGGDTLRLLRVDSTVSRVNNWQDTLQLIQRSPIVGHGFNTLRFIERKGILQRPGDPLSRAAAGVDNSFLFLLATTGVIGLGIYCWLLWKGRGMTRASHAAILAAIVVHSQFINSLFYPWIMLWIWIYLGATENLRKNREK
jgi:hypothetical protein